MPFEPVQQEKLSTSVIKQIELLILRGILRPGERLPSERLLAEKLGVSRPSLREAISTLQESGLLTARAGSGIYVAEVLGSSFSPALVQLFSRHEEAVFDYIAFRRDMEGLAAERAVLMGSDLDLQVIQTAYDKMAQTLSGRADPNRDADLDAAFHMAIFEAGHNVVMLHMMRSMYELLREGVFYNRTRMFHQGNMRQELLAQHGAINDALQARDATAARAAVETHLDFVETSLTAQFRADRNAAIAQQRISHATGG